MTEPRTIVRVLATVRFGPAELDRLREAFAPAEFRHCAPDDADGIAEALRTADVAVIDGDLSTTGIWRRRGWPGCTATTPA